jgi:hypothetical protein
MKNYYLILFENIIGILYMFLFLYGNYVDNEILSLVGGIGTTLFILIITLGQPSKQFMLLFFFSISLFFTKSWVSIFWVSTFFTFGQIFSMVNYVSNREDIIPFGSDNFSRIEIFYFLVLIIVPFFVTKLIL